MNKISCLKDGDEELLQDIDQIGMACVEYYKSIYDLVEIPEINMEGIENIQLRRIIDQEVALYLQLNVSDNEIIEALNDIPDDKAPGNDGSLHICSKWRGGLLVRTLFEL